MAFNKASYFIVDALNPWLSTKNYCPLLTRSFDNIWGQFRVSHPERRCCLHLRMRVPECCLSSTLHRNTAPLPKRIIWFECQYYWGREIPSLTNGTLIGLFEKGMLFSMCGSRILYIFTYIFLFFLLLVVVLFLFSALY